MLKFTKNLLLISFIGVFSVFGQNLDRGNLQTDFAKKENRTRYKKEMAAKVAEVFGGKLSNSTEENWRELFDAVTINLYKTPAVKAGLDKGLRESGGRSLQFRKMLLESIYTLYPEEYYSEMDSVFRNTKDPDLYAYAVNYLPGNSKNTLNKDQYIEETKKRFDPDKELVIKLLLEDLENNTPALTKADLKELLSAPFGKGTTVIYSLHRKERRFPGLTLVKNPEGEFVKDDSSRIAMIPQLAASVGGIPYYLRGGDTPQGIYSVQGWYVSPTKTIGPTPAVLTRIPFEKPPKTFFHGQNKHPRWHSEDYAALLPETFKKYTPLWQSYYAGKLGRKLIVMHGSVDDLSFYEGKSYYPHTPTKGCISAIETWDEDTGRVVKSDQLELMKAFKSAGEQKGYLVVIDIDDKKSPVTRDEILDALK